MWETMSEKDEQRIETTIYFSGGDNDDSQRSISSLKLWREKKVKFRHLCVRDWLTVKTSLMESTTESSSNVFICIYFVSYSFLILCFNIIFLMLTFIWCTPLVLLVQCFYSIVFFSVNHIEFLLCMNCAVQINLINKLHNMSLFPNHSLQCLCTGLPITFNWWGGRMQFWKACPPRAVSVELCFSTSSQRNPIGLTFAWNRVHFHVWVSMTCCVCPVIQYCHMQAFMLFP